MKKRKMMILLLCTTMIASLAGCGNGMDPKGNENSKQDLFSFDSSKSENSESDRTIESAEANSTEQKKVIKWWWEAVDWEKTPKADLASFEIKGNPDCGYIGMEELDQRYYFSVRDPETFDLSYHPIKDVSSQEMLAPGADQGWGLIPMEPAIKANETGEGAPSGEGVMHVLNLSTEDLTAWECIENNWYYIDYFSKYSNCFLQQWGDMDLIDIVRDYGKPDLIMSIFGLEECFQPAQDLQDVEFAGQDLPGAFSIVYEFDNVVIVATQTETHNHKATYYDSDLEFAIYTKECWNDYYDQLPNEKKVVRTTDEL